MKTAVIFLFWFTYCYEAKSNATTKMLQIDGLKKENILPSTGEIIFYEFTNDEKLTATCRREKANGRFSLTWYKSGIKLNTTNEDKLEQSFILKEIDADTSLECRLRAEDSRNEDNQNYQEGKMITLKYNTTPIKKIVLSSVEPVTEAPPHLGITINKEIFVYGFITLIVIILVVLLILITKKINKKLKNLKENKRIRTVKAIENDYKDPSLDQVDVYSVPYSDDVKIYLRSIPHVNETQKILDTTVYGKFINNDYYQSRENYQNLYNNVNQNVPLIKDILNDYDDVPSNLYSI